jgi:hypothetical protein
LGKEILSKVVLQKKRKARVRFLAEKQTYGFRITKGLG